MWPSELRVLDLQGLGFKAAWVEGLEFRISFL